MKCYLVILFSFSSLALADQTQTILNYSDQSYLVVFKYKDSFTGHRNTNQVIVGPATFKKPTQIKTGQPGMPPLPPSPLTLEPGKEVLESKTGNFVINISIYRSNSKQPENPLYSSAISQDVSNKTFSIYKNPDGSLKVE